jgi:hypothetical protein
MVYQAANWSYHGQTNPDVVLVEPNGKRHHSRSLRTTYKGAYKPFVRRLRAMAECGELREVSVAGKHIYTYNLQGIHRRTGSAYPKADLVHNEPDIMAIEMVAAQGRML